VGWPLRTAANYREFGGSFIDRWATTCSTIGRVAGSNYRDVELSPHDLL